MTYLRILVTGSREWTDERAILSVLGDAAGDTPAREITLMHGTCRGADVIAERLARDAGWAIERYPADWARHGDAAGQIRNERMVKVGADVCIAFIRDKSPGASTTARKADRAGIRTVVWRHEGDRVWLDDRQVDTTGVNPDQGELF